MSGIDTARRRDQGLYFLLGIGFRLASPHLFLSLIFRYSLFTLFCTGTPSRFHVFSLGSCADLDCAPTQLFVRTTRFSGLIGCNTRRTAPPDGQCGLGEWLSLTYVLYLHVSTANAGIMELFDLFSLRRLASCMCYWTGSSSTSYDSASGACVWLKAWECYFPSG